MTAADTPPAPEGSAPWLQARRLACLRGGRLLFRGVDFTVRGGESLLLQGPNGTGKSSLLRLLAGLLPVAAGTVRHQGRLALADDRLALDGDTPLGRALAFWAKMDGSDAAGLRDALSAFSLTGLAEVPVRMLSTGQRKRAILARTLAGGADIWLLDEPGNGLDSASLGALNRAMEAHVARGGLIVAATHFPLEHRFVHTLALDRRMVTDEDDEDDGEAEA